MMGDKKKALNTCGGLPLTPPIILVIAWSILSLPRLCAAAPHTTINLFLLVSGFLVDLC